MEDTLGFVLRMQCIGDQLVVAMLWCKKNAC